MTLTITKNDATIAEVDHSNWNDIFEKEMPKLEKEMKTFASKFWFPAMTSEDIEQEFRCAVYDCIKFWDPNHGALSTIVWNRWYMITKNLMKHYSCQKRGGLVAGTVGKEIIMNNDTFINFESDHGFDRTLGGTNMQETSFLREAIEDLSDDAKQLVVALLSDDDLTTHRGHWNANAICRKFNWDKKHWYKIRRELTENEQFLEALGLE